MNGRPSKLKYGSWYWGQDGNFYQCRGEYYANSTYLLRRKNGAAFTASGVSLHEGGTIHWERAYGHRYMKY